MALLRDRQPGAGCNCGRDFFIAYNMLLGFDGGVTRGDLPPPMTLGSLATFDSPVPAIAAPVFDQFSQGLGAPGISSRVKTAISSLGGRSKEVPADVRAAGVIADISASTLRLPRAVLRLLPKSPEWSSGRMVIPKQLARQVFDALHVFFHHHKLLTLHYCHSLFTWPSSYADVRKWLRPGACSRSGWTPRSPPR